MSDIPRAREILAGLLAYDGLDPTAADAVKKALSMMTREEPIRRARAKAVKITPAVRAQVKDLNRAGIPQAEIAQLTGLRNGGRVSEILNWKR